MNEQQSEKLERNLHRGRMFKIKRWVLDGRLENLLATERLGKMHQVLNMRDVLPRRRNQVAAGKGRHLV